MGKEKRLIVLGVVGLVFGGYFGATSGSSNLLIRGIVGVVMGLVSVWLVSGFVR